MDFMREHLVTRADLALLEERFDEKYAKQESLDKLFKSFDKFAKETRQEREENTTKNYRLDRLENWAETAAEKIKIPFKS